MAGAMIVPTLIIVESRNPSWRLSSVIEGEAWALKCSEIVAPWIRAASPRSLAPAPTGLPVGAGASERGEAARIHGATISLHLSAHASPSMTELKRQLGFLDSTMINVGTIIAPAILVWVAGGAVSLLGALAVAELGAAMPKAGGLYAYLGEAYGPVWGYLYGWTAGVVINPASIAAIAVGFATYVGFFVPLGAAGIKSVAILSILALTVLNCLGVKPGTVTQNVLTLIKIGLVAALIVIGFVLPGGSVANFEPLWPDASPGSLIAPFGIAMVAVLWAYDGWIEITYVGGEVKDPGRNLPRSVVLSTLIAVALYCLVTASFAYVLSP